MDVELDNDNNKNRNESNRNSENTVMRPTVIGRERLNDIIDQVNRNGEVEQEPAMYVEKQTKYEMSKEEQTNYQESKEHVEQEKVVEKLKDKQKPEVVLDDGSDDDEEIVIAETDDTKKVKDEEFDDQIKDIDEDYANNFGEISDSDENEIKPDKNGVLPDSFEVELDDGEDEKKRKLEEDKIFKQAKEVYRHSTNNTIKILKDVKFNPNDIRLSEMNYSDDDFRKYYLDTRYNILSAPRAVRVPLVLSGYFADVSSYTQGDFISVNRNAKLSTFVRRKELTINSLFSHVIYTSLRKDIDFDFFINNTKLPDIDVLYFGAYDANFYGENTYTLRCDECGNEFEYSTLNEDLGVIYDKDVPEDYLKKLLYMRDQEILENPLYKKSNRIVKRILNKTKIYVEQKVPTIKDYLETIKALEQISKVDKSADINVEDIDNPLSDDYISLRMFLYINKIGLPVPRSVNNKIKIKYVEVVDKYKIINILLKLDPMDFDSLFVGEEIKELFNLSSIKFFIKGAVCTNPNCKQRIAPIPLKMEELFFFRIGALMNR